MAKVIKQEGEEKYVQDIFLNMKEYAKLAEKQKDGEDFRFSTFISIYDKSGKIELPYFLSREEYDTGAIIGVPYIHLGLHIPAERNICKK